jgi:Rps23 Pro-64 3,4-dihydroxylase Tpa1-like proline 4-hydroxylase
MSRNTPLRLSAVRTFSEPFLYLVSPEALNPEVSLTILTWFEAHAPWKLVETDFYEQFEFSLWDVQLPANLAFVRASSFIAAIKKRMAERFDAHLSDRLDITAHKLVPGQRIRLHNDFIPGAETHRLLIQFNRGWHDENGGLLIFFNSADPADIHKIFQPVHNSAVGFAISATSYHAVSKLHGGERFTLVYSFYER